MHKQRGATIMEAALVLPVFLLLLLAIFEFGLLFSAYHSMVGATRQGARYAAAPDPAVSDPTNYYALPSAGAVAYVVCQKLQAGVWGTIASCPNYPSGTPNATASCPPYASGTAPNLAVEDVYVNVCTMPAGPYDNQGKQAATEKYVQVAVHRTVQLMFGWKIPLSTRTFMRLETN